MARGEGAVKAQAALTGSPPVAPPSTGKSTAGEGGEDGRIYFTVFGSSKAIPGRMVAGRRETEGKLRGRVHMGG
jgi:hypothetical protein